MKTDKYELLDEIKSYEEKNISFGFFITTYLFMLLAILFVAPKIYIKSAIYYESRKIAKLKLDYQTLKEENSLLSQKLETLRFKNQVLDAMF